MGSRKDKQRLLKSLLAPLVYEWGAEEVRKCLQELETDVHEDADDSAGGGYPWRRPTQRQALRAIDLATRASTSETQKPLLIAIASKFDEKTFLPTGSDVRHFLEMRGHHAGVIKKRQDSFRQVLAVLLMMTDDELRAFAETEAHSGPTQLGPLSDAIKATGAAVRTTETRTNKDQHESDPDHEDVQKKEGS